MDNEKTTLLEMRNIQKAFFGNQVLTDINLSLKEGEVIGLVGENGAGKSTLMRILFGADMIRETGGYGGQVLVNGEEVHFKSPFDAIAAGIGMVVDQNASIAGAQGGCQAECGTAAGMAAAALVELAGGSPRQIGNAVALSIKNLLGLVCDPVAGLVEVSVSSLSIVLYFQFK